MALMKVYDALILSLIIDLSPYSGPATKNLVYDPPSISPSWAKISGIKYKEALCYNIRTKLLPTKRKTLCFVS